MLGGLKVAKIKIKIKIKIYGNGHTPRSPGKRSASGVPVRPRLDPSVRWDDGVMGCRTGAAASP
ncbi:hypothetical protein GCM10027359_25210 [Marilutibacter aestuarii]